MIKTTDGTQSKRIGGLPGDRAPASGFQRLRATYTAAGGETSINLGLLVPAISYIPGRANISVKRSTGGDLISGTDFYETSTTTVGFPTFDPLVAGEVVEITQEYSVSGVMAVTPRPDMHTETAVASQTLVTANFSWPYNFNSGKGRGAVSVVVHGLELTRDVDYTEVNLGTGNTNQVILTLPCVGGENIAIKPIYQVIDQTAASSTFNSLALQNMQAMCLAGFSEFVDESSDMIDVPATTISGRAKIPNLANDLRASLGIERIPVQQIVQLQDEFGPNGEPVYAALNDIRGLIRFVGVGWINNNGNAYGQFAYTITAGNYFEITFCGTGLNFLTQLNADARDASVTVDGALVRANGVYPGASGSFVIGNRNYNPNQILPLTIAPLSFGIHTVKVTCLSNNLNVMGFEILNINASGLMNVNPGTSYKNGQKYINTLADSVGYNKDSLNVNLLSGAKGGRVVRYALPDGTLSQAVTEVDTSAAYGNSTNHTNEEIARTYHWREFGAGRNDIKDFSTFTGSADDRAFTLDDGTTSLAGKQVHSYTAWSGRDFVMASAVGSFITFTFVGTGLDILICSHNDTTGVTGSQSIIVDGTIVYTGTIAIGAPNTMKICSGLAYGTHTVKFLVNAGGGVGDMGIIRFSVYQPQKPTLPTNAIELADYNIMADYVTSTINATGISQGVLQKGAARETVYVGTWYVGGIDPPTSGSHQLYNAANGSYSEDTFFGTGFEARWRAQSGLGNNVLVYLQNLSTGGSLQVLNSTNFPGLTTGTNGGGSFTYSTGVWVQYNVADIYGSRFYVAGLPLGLYKVKFLNQTSGYMYHEALDIITPIHSYKSNLYADLQNTLPIGSQSLCDSRKTSIIKEALPAQKAWAQAVGITVSATTASTTAVPVPDLNVTLKTKTSNVRIHCCLTHYITSNGAIGYIYMDGLQVGIPFHLPINDVFTSNFSCEIPVSEGVHNFAVYWRSTAGNTLSTYNANRILTVQEI